MSNPERLRAWKKNIRKRHSARVKIRTRCDHCGHPPSKVGRITRHHDWTNRQPGDPPPVEAHLCRQCHNDADRHPVKFVCAYCNEEHVGKLRHYRRCKARAIWLQREFDEWEARAASGQHPGRRKTLD